MGRPDRGRSGVARGLRGEVRGRWASVTARVLTIVLAGLALSCPAANAWRGRGHEPERQPAASPRRVAEDPLQIVVSIGSQRLFVYDRIGLLEQATVSTGVGGKPTPTGVFSVLDKEWQHYSNIYGAASMPFMQRLTMSGVAMHSGMVTGRPASHGCIRLPHAFAIKLYRLTKLGARVVIAANEPTPVDIAHPNLFVRKPAPTPSLAVHGGGTAASALATAAELEKGLVDARLGKITAERWRELDAQPISVFVSRAEGKVFVRHGFRPLFEAPVTIRDPDSRLGTHVFTALEYRDETRTVLRWQALTLPPEQSRPERLSARMPRAREPHVLGQGLPSSAAEALDRIVLPADAADRIAVLVAPGSSLIVSDHGVSREMRDNGTDFIVLTQN
jgi:hypothetical protein